MTSLFLGKSWRQENIRKPDSTLALLAVISVGTPEDLTHIPRKTSSSSSAPNSHCKPLPSWQVRGVGVRHPCGFYRPSHVAGHAVGGSVASRGLSSLGSIRPTPGAAAKDESHRAAPSSGEREGFGRPNESEDRTDVESG